MNLVCLVPLRVLVVFENCPQLSPANSFQTVKTVTSHVPNPVTHNMTEEVTDSFNFSIIFSKSRLTFGDLRFMHTFVIYS